MISGVRSVGIDAKDQDRAKEFWVEKMGFELLLDVPMSEDTGAARWIEVTPPDHKVILVLFSHTGQQSEGGAFSNVIFTCDDIQKTYEELSARGVDFAEPPSQQMWGWWSIFKDPDGNMYGLGQHQQ